MEPSSHKQHRAEDTRIYPGNSDDPGHIYLLLPVFLVQGHVVAIVTVGILSKNVQARRTSQVVCGIYNLQVWEVRDCQILLQGNGYYPSV
eukprot:c27882_g2_i2 orf=398-667(+)